MVGGKRGKGYTTVEWNMREAFFGSDGSLWKMIAGWIYALLYFSVSLKKRERLGCCLIHGGISFA